MITSVLDDGMVTLGGVVENAQSRIGRVVYTLPVEQRPERYLALFDAAPGRTLTAEIHVDTDGRVKLVAARDATVRMDAFAFKIQADA